MWQLLTNARFLQFLKSLNVYFLLIRYSAIGILSFIIDVSVFALLYWVTDYKLYSLLIGRIVSGTFNFYFNKYLVYRSMEQSYLRREAFSYVSLALVIFVLSYSSITELVNHFQVNIIVAKILVDVVLFFVNFIVQKYLFKTGTIASLRFNSDEEEPYRSRN